MRKYISVFYSGIQTLRFLSILCSSYIQLSFVIYALVNMKNYAVVCFCIHQILNSGTHLCPGTVALDLQHTRTQGLNSSNSEPNLMARANHKQQTLSLPKMSQVSCCMQHLLQFCITFSVVLYLYK